MRYHKKRHKFADTPSDKCLCKTGIEDTHHFLMLCPFYTSHREILLSRIEASVGRLDNVENLAQILLYGHPSLSNAENKNILNATLDFIIKTKRFAK